MQTKRYKLSFSGSITSESLIVLDSEITAVTKRTSLRQNRECLIIESMGLRTATRPRVIELYFLAVKMNSSEFLVKARAAFKSESNDHWRIIT